MADTDKALAGINRINILEAQDFLKRATRYKALVNRKYEGTVRGHGDQVGVQTVGRINWSPYSRGQTLLRQVPTRTHQSMRIDRAMYMNAVNDDVDDKQEMPKSRAFFVERSMYSLGQDVDRIISTMYTDVANANAIGTDASPITITRHNVYEAINSLLYHLLGSDVSEEMAMGISCLVPLFVEQMLQLDVRYTGGGNDGNNKAYAAAASGEGRDQLASGMPPKRVGGMNVMWSNNCPKVGVNYKIIAAHTDATSYAEQMTKFGWHEPSETFMGGYKGLYVSGMHTFEPKAMAVMTVAPPAASESFLVS